MSTRAFALALGVVKLTDLVKELFDRAGTTPYPYVKSLVSTGLAVGAGAAYGGSSWKDRILLASEIAGAAAVLHEGQAVLASATERNRAHTIKLVARGGINAAMPTAPGRRVPTL